MLSRDPQKHSFDKCHMTLCTLIETVIYKRESKTTKLQVRVLHTFPFYYGAYLIRIRLNDCISELLKHFLFTRPFVTWKLKNFSQFSLGDKMLHIEVEVVPGQRGRLAWTECYSGVEGG